MQSDNTHISVIDSPPGTGKTSWAIDYINNINDPDIKVIYITPFLSEVKRVKTACLSKEFIEPDIRFGNGRKMTNLLKLIIAGKNIVSTHALFSKIDDEIINALVSQNYVLFLDEVFQTVDKWSVSGSASKSINDDSITKNDIDSLLNKGYISIADDYTVRWIDQDYRLSKYEDIRLLANRDLLYWVDGCLLIWTFPITVFREGIFDKIFILTYLFESQIQSFYYNYFELEYRKYHIVETNYDDNSKEYNIEETIDDNYASKWIDNVKTKISITDSGKLNRIGDNYKDNRGHLYQSALSVTWYKDNPSLVATVRNNLYNFYTNNKSKVADRLWTCFKDNYKGLKNKRCVEKNWIPINARSVNDYGDRTSLAYPVNRYLDPFYDKFFAKRNIHINQNLYALSDLLQWVFRSAIRNDKEIELYLPSERMRNLLDDYLNNKIDK